MRQFVIFSEEEIDKLCVGNPVEDEVNHITYMSEAAYEKYLEKKEEEDRW